MKENHKKAEESLVVHNDEPTSIDRLNRCHYARAFARLAETCETPLVIGLYGQWGIGKSSLMKLIEKELNQRKTRVIWFDPWHHQFDDNPALALLHTVVEVLGLKEQGKKLLMTIASAFGSMLLKATTTLNLEDVDNIGKRFEEERFQVHETRVRLQEYFRKIILLAQGENTEYRLIFFIDDLDRCMPPQILMMLEALKLYLNLPGCIYFLGVDRGALETSIRHHYKELEISEMNYLDKIVQLPFTIPPIAPESMENFILPLLSSELRPCIHILIRGLQDNPRQVKRFINALKFNYYLASELTITDYKADVLALLLLIQYRSPDLYHVLIKDPSLLVKLGTESEESKTLRQEHLVENEWLKDLLFLVTIPLEPNLKQYIYLSQVASVSVEKLDEHDQNMRLTEREQEVLKWVSRGKNTWEISTILGISQRTVSYHLSNIMQKLNATSRTHALAIALDLGLIDLNEKADDEGTLNRTMHHDG